MTNLIRSFADGEVGHVVLDRPQKRNAMTTEMLLEVRDRAHELAQQVRVICVRGSQGVFSAGADIAEWFDVSADTAESRSARGRTALTELSALPVPTIAVVEGLALGGGLELALACDLRIAAVDAKLGLPELTLGNLPGWGGMARLRDVTSLAVVRRMVLTAEIVDGDEAARRGIVHEAHPPAEVDAAVERGVAAVLTTDAASARHAKMVMVGLVSDSPTEPAIAGLSAVSQASHARKQAFLDGRRAKAATR
ncbi:enoyl-CoA hydratase/isomerase family protein [Pseudactinotalea sp.]|uniref:enoyl-CoA hydratase/isomerase family protein n=1 Tax=Pseudactinotalea sp. TaxID=1926260 RepID=UPI003B3B676C